MKKLWFLFLGLILLFVSFFFDKAISLFFVSLRNPFFDYVSWFFSKTIVQVFVFFVIPFLILLFNNKKSAILFGISFAVVVFFTYLLKFLVSRPRPYLALSLPLIPLLSYSFSYFNTSFPSSHTSSSFSSFAALEKFQKLKWFWLLLCIVVVLTRLYDGVHYMSDVVAGSLLGYFLTVFVFWLDKRYHLFRARL